MFIAPIGQDKNTQKKEDKHLAIQKSGNGISVIVVVDKDHLKQIESIVSVESKFQKIKVKKRVL